MHWALVDALWPIQQDSCLLGGLAAGERRIFGASPYAGYLD